MGEYCGNESVIIIITIILRRLKGTTRTALFNGFGEECESLDGLYQSLIRRHVSLIGFPGSVHSGPEEGGRNSQMAINGHAVTIPPVSTTPPLDKLSTCPGVAGTATRRGRSDSIYLSSWACGQCNSIPSLAKRKKWLICC